MLVSGGAGFIGSHLVDALVARGDQVTVIDDLSTGRHANLNPAAAFHQVDICDPAALERAFASASPQTVFHLAAQISVALSVREPARDARVNVMGSLNVLDAARRSGSPKVVFASTGGAIYGEPERLPVEESDDCRPISPYAASKLAVEHYLATYRVAYGLDYTILRLGNIYGPRQDPHGEAGVVAIFARAMLADEEVTIFGDGNDERDYVYVSDAVDALVRASETGRPAAYNVGSGEGASVNFLATELARLTGYRREPVHGDPRAGDIRRLKLNAQKARRELGWRPEVPLEDGLQRTVEFFREEATDIGR